MSDEKSTTGQLDDINTSYVNVRELKPEEWDEFRAQYGTRGDRSRTPSQGSDSGYASSGSDSHRGETFEPKVVSFNKYRNTDSAPNQNPSIAKIDLNGVIAYMGDFSSLPSSVSLEFTFSNDALDSLYIHTACTDLPATADEVTSDLHLPGIVQDFENLHFRVKGQIGYNAQRLIEDLGKFHELNAALSQHEADIKNALSTYGLFRRFKYADEYKGLKDKLAKVQEKKQIAREHYVLTAGIAANYLHKNKTNLSTAQIDELSQKLTRCTTAVKQAENTPSFPGWVSSLFTWTKFKKIPVKAHEFSETEITVVVDAAVQIAKHASNSIETALEYLKLAKQAKEKADEAVTYARLNTKAADTMAETSGAEAKPFIEAADRKRYDAIHSLHDADKQIKQHKQQAKKYFELAIRQESGLAKKTKELLLKLVNMTDDTDNTAIEGDLAGLKLFTDPQWTIVETPGGEKVKKDICTFLQEFFELDANSDNQHPAADWFINQITQMFSHTKPPEEYLKELGRHYRNYLALSRIVMPTLKQGYNDVQVDHEHLIKTLGTTFSKWLDLASLDIADYRIVKNWHRQALTLYKFFKDAGYDIEFDGLFKPINEKFYLLLMRNVYSIYSRGQTNLSADIKREFNELCSNENECFQLLDEQDKNEIRLLSKLMRIDGEELDADPDRLIELLGLEVEGEALHTSIKGLNTKLGTKPNDMPAKNLLIKFCTEALKSLLIKMNRRDINPSEYSVNLEKYIKYFNVLQKYDPESAVILNDKFYKNLMTRVYKFALDGNSKDDPIFSEIKEKCDPNNQNFKLLSKEDQDNIRFLLDLTSIDINKGEDLVKILENRYVRNADAQLHQPLDNLNKYLEEHFSCEEIVVKRLTQILDDLKNKLHGLNKETEDYTKTYDEYYRFLQILEIYSPAASGEYTNLTGNILAENIAEAINTPLFDKLSSRSDVVTPIAASISSTAGFSGFLWTVPVKRQASEKELVERLKDMKAMHEELNTQYEKIHNLEVELREAPADKKVNVESKLGEAKNHANQLLSQLENGIEDFKQQYILGNSKCSPKVMALYREVTLQLLDVELNRIEQACRSILRGKGTEQDIVQASKITSFSEQLQFIKQNMLNDNTCSFEAEAKLSDVSTRFLYILEAWLQNRQGYQGWKMETVATMDKALNPRDCSNLYSAIKDTLMPARSSGAYGCSA